MMRKIFHDPRQQASFLDTGYVHVPMLSATDVQAILKELQSLTPDDNFAPISFDSYHCSFVDTNVAYRRKTFELLSRVFAPHIDAVLSGYRILNCNFYVKPPGTGQFRLHQNWPGIADLHDTTVSIWCPLIDVVAENGALQFVVGSHKLLPHVESPGCPGYFQNFHDAVIDKYLTPIPMQAGEALIFDDGLIHWSARNASASARVAIQISCVPDDSTTVFYSLDRDNPDRFELIETDQEFFLTTMVGELFSRQPHWTRLGYAPNRNRMLTEDEFADLLRNGRDIRDRVYANGGWDTDDRHLAVSTDRGE